MCKRIGLIVRCHILLRISCQANVLVLLVRKMYLKNYLILNACSFLDLRSNHAVLDLAQSSCEPKSVTLMSQCQYVFTVLCHDDLTGRLWSGRHRLRDADSLKNSYLILQFIQYIVNALDLERDQQINQCIAQK